MSLKQEEQDRIWEYTQSQNLAMFDLSYPRLRYLAERCRAGTRVLNIGVGSGYLEDLLIARGIEVYSLDPSAASIERLRARHAMGERAQSGYGQAMPFATGLFDVVIMTEVLEHLAEEVLHRTLDEVHRVLKPGGEFIGTVPYRENLAANEVRCPCCDATFHRWGHEQSFDAPRLRGVLEQHGFRVSQLYARAFPDFRRLHPTLLLKALFRYVLGRIGEPLVAPNLYFSVCAAPASARPNA